MKYITFAVPCYNSENYMRRCVDSLLIGGKDVEIILIDDGSSDRTAQIADEYEIEYPDIVRVVHKENGGHGSSVNKGLELANGIYYKVVDSDDWFDKESYQKLLVKLKAFTGERPDLIVCNYVYDHLDEGIKKSMDYKNVFPIEKQCTWDEIGKFYPSQYLIMHSLMFQTKVLRESEVKLPEHTFYVDNLFSYKPLPYAETIYYMDIDLYHYYLGRDDQSVNEKVLMKRIDQQILVTDLVTRSVDLAEVKKIHPKLEAYMVRNISIMLTISSIHLLLIDTADSYKKRKDMWSHVKEYNEALYYRLRFRTLSGFTYLPGKIGASLTIGGYRLAKKVYRFQ